MTGLYTGSTEDIQSLLRYLEAVGDFIEDLKRKLEID